MILTSKEYSAQIIRRPGINLSSYANLLIYQPNPFHQAKWSYEISRNWYLSL